MNQSTLKHRVYCINFLYFKERFCLSKHLFYNGLVGCNLGNDGSLLFQYEHAPGWTNRPTQGFVFAEQSRNPPSQGYRMLTTGGNPKIINPSAFSTRVSAKVNEPLTCTGARVPNAFSA